MALNISNAINAYTNAAKSATGLDAREGSDPSGGFADLVREATGNAVTTIKKGEAMSLQAIMGKADMADVITAVNNAEVTLQTVVAVRDKVIQAYQDIIRMPL